MDRLGIHLHYIHLSHSVWTCQQLPDKHTQISIYSTLFPSLFCSTVLFWNHSCKSGTSPDDWPYFCLYYLNCPCKIVIIRHNLRRISLHMPSTLPACPWVYKSNFDTWYCRIFGVLRPNRPYRAWHFTLCSLISYQLTPSPN